MPKRAGKGPIKTIARGMGKANNALGQITAVLDQQSQQLAQIQTGSQAQHDSNQGDSRVLMSIKIQQAQLELQKDQTAFLKKISDGQSKQIDALQKGNKDWKSVGEKFKDMKRNLADALDPTTIKKAMLGPFSMFKGARNKMEDLDYTKRMKALGSNKSPQDLAKDSKQQRGYKESALRSQEGVDRLKSMGATDDQISQSAAMKNRNAALNNYNRLNQVNPTDRDSKNSMGGNVSYKSAGLTQLPSDKGKVSQSTTDVLAEQQAAHESQVEMLRLTGMQTDLLQQIATNTAITSGASSSSSGGAEDSGKSARPRSGGSSMASGLSDSMSSLGQGVAAVGKGIGDGIGGIFAGILGGLSDGIKTFASAKTVAGIAVMALLTGVVWGMSKALDGFSNLDWDTLAKAGVTLAGLIGAGALAGSIAPMLGLGALALAGLGASVWVIGEAMNAMGEGLKNFADGIERLAAIDGSNLVSVAAGVAALGAAIAAFGAGQAVGGMGNLVGGFLGAVTPGGSPIDQLIKIGDAGAGVKDAADGMEKMSGAMAAFSKVDPDSMKAVKDFPWEKATAFVAAGGAMKAAGASVYSQSAANADANAKSQGGSSIVNAPKTSIQSNNNQTNVIKQQVRNTESSFSKYLSARY